MLFIYEPRPSTLIEIAAKTLHFLRSSNAAEPDLGNSKRNALLDSLLQEFARRLIAILQDEK